MHTISFGISCSVRIICSINIQYPANVLSYQTFTFPQENTWDKVEFRIYRISLERWICFLGSFYRVKVGIIEFKWSTVFFPLSLLGHHYVCSEGKKSRILPSRSAKIAIFRFYFNPSYDNTSFT